MTEKEKMIATISAQIFCTQTSKMNLGKDLDVSLEFIRAFCTVLAVDLVNGAIGAEEPAFKKTKSNANLKTEK